MYDTGGASIVQYSAATSTYNRCGLYIERLTSIHLIIVGFYIDRLIAEPYTSVMSKRSTQAPSLASVTQSPARGWACMEG